jgi:hypothetical protein
MSSSQIIPLLVFLAAIFLYLLFSTRFKRGWTQKGIIVKGGRINLLLFLSLVFIVLVIVVRTTVR